MHSENGIVEQTLLRLRALYQDERLEAGALVKVGIKSGWNVVIGTRGQCGMAMNFTGWEQSFGKSSIDLARLQTFAGRDLFAVAEAYLQAPSWQERSIGVAAVSALSQPLITPEQLHMRGFEAPDGDLDFASLLRPDDIAAVVGYGGGIRRLLGRCRELHVTDMRPRDAFQTLVVGEEIGYSPAEVQVHSEQENKSVLGRATAVSITGSSLVNGTFEELLGYAANARVIAVYGASACLIPDVLLARGVHLIHTYRVSDPQAFERGMLNDLNMEGAVRSTQTQQTMRRRSA